MSENELVEFTATLLLYDKNSGGRETPVKSGFRTDIQFEDQVRFSSITFDSSKMSPGESKEVSVSMLLHGGDEVDYYLGTGPFKIIEGPYTIGEISNFKKKD